jgi:hypothetical protein
MLGAGTRRVRLSRRYHGPILIDELSSQLIVANR